jgi:hypothetical protein
MDSQPSNGWFAVGAFVSATIGLAMVVVSNWLTIACLALALGIQAFASTKGRRKVEANRIWFVAGAFFSAAIGAVLVLVDSIWLTLPISAVGLGIGAFVRARQRAKLEWTRSFRIVVGALVSAVVGAVAALIGFQLTIALTILPLAAAHYRRTKRDPKAVKQNLKLMWAAHLSAITAAIIGFAVLMVALNQQLGGAARDFDQTTARMGTDMTDMTNALNHMAQLPMFKVDDCIGLTEGAVQTVPCASSVASGRVLALAPRSSACPEGADYSLENGDFAQVACIVVRPRLHRAR